jgi:hypothetical protein
MVVAAMRWNSTNVDAWLATRRQIKAGRRARTRHADAPMR